MVHEQTATPDTRVEIDIQVNGKQVRMTERHATGLQIKEAAIAQGVAIGLDFVLSEELGNHKARVVRDDETVTLRLHQEFVATAPDDNS